MLPKTLTWTLLLILSVNLSYGQQLDTLFIGGSSSYSSILSSNIKYPPESFRNGTKGVLVFSISVDSTAKVNLRLLTKLDDEIEQEIIKSLSPITKNWIAKKEPYQLYQPIIFDETGYNREKQPYSSFLNSELVLAPITVLAFSKTTLVTERVSIGNGANSGSSVNSTPSLVQTTSSSTTTYKSTFKELERLEKKYEKFTEKEKWEKAYQTLNEIIRLNPFNKEYILKRNQIESELNLNNYTAYDLAWFKALNRILATS